MRKATLILGATLLMGGQMEALAEGYSPSVLTPLAGGGYAVPLLGPNGGEALASTPQALVSLKPSNCRMAKKQLRCRKFQSYALGLDHFMRSYHLQSLKQETQIEQLQSNLVAEQQANVAQQQANAREVYQKSVILAELANGCRPIVQARGGTIYSSTYNTEDQHTICLKRVHFNKEFSNATTADLEAGLFDQASRFTLKRVLNPRDLRAYGSGVFRIHALSVKDNDSLILSNAFRASFNKAEKGRGSLILEVIPKVNLTVSTYISFEQWTHVEVTYHRNLRTGETDIGYDTIVVDGKRAHLDSILTSEQKQAHKEALGRFVDVALNYFEIKDEERQANSEGASQN